MKKIVCLIGIFTLVLSFNAFGASLVQTQDTAQAVSGDGSFSSTYWWGNWNDNAGAIATGVSRAENTNQGEAAFGPAIAGGFAGAENESKTWSWAKDYGTTSKAGAGAKTEGAALAGGLGAGFFGNNNSESMALVGGTVEQFNEAGETGYGQTGAVAGNISGGVFEVGDHDYDKGLFEAHTLAGAEGKIITKGESFVTVDPYGHKRSAYASTENMVDIDVDTLDCRRPDYYNGVVFGAGNVDQQSGKGGTVAGGGASFVYGGNNFGAGQAQSFSEVHVHSNSSTAFSTSSAFAIGQ